MVQNLYLHISVIERLMNSKIVSFSGMAIAALAIFFASGHIGNQPAIAYGEHGLGHGLGHFYGHGLGHYYGPGYLGNLCGGLPYSVINGQIVCTG
jgi:hypothetical protein